MKNLILLRDWLEPRCSAYGLEIMSIFPIRTASSPFRWSILISQSYDQITLWYTLVRKHVSTNISISYKYIAFIYVLLIRMCMLDGTSPILTREEVLFLQNHRYFCFKGWTSPMRWQAIFNLIQTWILDRCKCRFPRGNIILTWPSPKSPLNKIRDYLHLFNEYNTALYQATFLNS